MHLVRCTLTLHDSLYYATREMGTLFETERYLHNYALSYALCGEWSLFGDLLTRSFFCASYRPEYASDLMALNQRGVYVTPALPLSWEYLLVTWKMGQVTYYRKPERFGERGNYPDNYGRAKELAPESTFQCYVLSQQPLKLPRWIRLGKWHSKTLVEAQQIDVRQASGDYSAACPLNPLDAPLGVLRAFDIVSMPPSSLVANARCRGDYYEIARGVGLPAGLAYRFP